MTLTDIAVLPLGVFGRMVREPDIGEYQKSLLALRGQIPEANRSAIASYLRDHASILAIMEHTSDLLEDRFGVSGGSAIASDGRYFWRREAAEYVEHYGIGLPADFLEHGRARHWQSCELTEQESLGIDRFLMRTLVRSPPGPC